MSDDVQVFTVFIRLIFYAGSGVVKIISGRQPTLTFLWVGGWVLKKYLFLKIVEFLTQLLQQ